MLLLLLGMEVGFQLCLRHLVSSRKLSETNMANIHFIMIVRTWVQEWY